MARRVRAQYTTCPVPPPQWHADIAISLLSATPTMQAQASRPQASTTTVHIVRSHDSHTALAACKGSISRTCKLRKCTLGHVPAAVSHAPSHNCAHCTALMQLLRLCSTDLPLLKIPQPDQPADLGTDIDIAHQRTSPCSTGKSSQLRGKGLLSNMTCAFTVRAM